MSEVARERVIFTFPPLLMAAFMYLCSRVDSITPSSHSNHFHRYSSSLILFAVFLHLDLNLPFLSSLPYPDENIFIEFMLLLYLV